jgi:hypothetical protein
VQQAAPARRPVSTLVAILAARCLSSSKASDSGIDVGDVMGDRVPQVYVGSGNAPALMAATALAQFTLITLVPQEYMDVTLHIAPRELSCPSTTQHTWVVSQHARRMRWVVVAQHLAAGTA